MNRTYGQTKDCRGCYYWSEMIAKSENGGNVQALCLNPASQYSGEYKFGLGKCNDWESGEKGVADEEGEMVYL